MEFINTEQRDPSANEILHPHCNKEKAINIISKYENSREMVKQGKVQGQYHWNEVFVQIVKIWKAFQRQCIVSN